MATPEIVMGASLLTLFVATALPPIAGSVPLLYPTGFATIVIAHIMFNISYVVVTVKARVSGFDRRLEEAAMDLGANELTTFWKVTFPLIFPGIMAAALLAFSLSIDDFVITNFASGTTNTFPIWVYSIQRNALPVQINVIGTIVFLGAVGARGADVAPRPGAPSGSASAREAPHGRYRPRPLDHRRGRSPPRPLGRPAGLGPDHEPRRGPRRGLAGWSRPTASGTSTTRPGSA